MSRKAAERRAADLRAAIGTAVSVVSPQERANYFVAAGHDSDAV